MISGLGKKANNLSLFELERKTFIISEYELE